MSQKAFIEEVKSGNRFEFGQNWKRFLTSIDEAKIVKAMKSLQHMFQVQTMEGKSFIDVGCGSGLFSLAAKKLGAKVFSFDYDPDSVICAQHLKSQFFLMDSDWEITTGSVLDKNFLNQLGQFDYVYSWGVLHHTGQMWNAIDNSISLVKPHGSCFIAIYNWQPFFSKYWWFVKKRYNRSPVFVKQIMKIGYTAYFVFAFFIADLLRRKNPVKRYRNSHKRGMNVFRDVLDWIGGWPFEMAKPEEIIDFFHRKHFSLTKLTTCAGKHGCNEFVFKK